jgi:YesN/AraC family two-component response regulator
MDEKIIVDNGIIITKEIIRKRQKNISEICYKRCYEDQSCFRNVFKKYTGLTSADYRKQFTFTI